MLSPRDKTRIVAERVVARIRDVSPQGLGRWDLAWELVAAPSDVFMDRLAEWEATDTPLTRRRLQTAAEALVAAWAEAARQWTEAGRPTLERPEEAIPL